MFVVRLGVAIIPLTRTGSSPTLGEQLPSGLFACCTQLDFHPDGLTP